MKLLFDENLSPKLVSRLQDLFPDSVHVAAVGLKQSPDEAIWRHALENDFALFTADDDFRQRALKLGPPPQVIILSRCDYPSRIIEQIIRREAIRIHEFSGSSKALLALHRE